MQTGIYRLNWLVWSTVREIKQGSCSEQSLLSQVNNKRKKKFAFKEFEEAAKGSLSLTGIQNKASSLEQGEGLRDSRPSGLTVA